VSTVSFILKDDLVENFTRDREQHDPTVVVAITDVSFLRQLNNAFLPLRLDFLLFPDIPEDVVSDVECSFTVLIATACISSGPDDYPIP
jgi:hypothetical protein